MVVFVLEFVDYLVGYIIDLSIFPLQYFDIVFVRVYHLQKSIFTYTVETFITESGLFSTESNVWYQNMFRNICLW